MVAYFLLVIIALHRKVHKLSMRSKLPISEGLDRGGERQRLWCDCCTFLCHLLDLATSYDTLPKYWGFQHLFMTSFWTVEDHIQKQISLKQKACQNAPHIFSITHNIFPAWLAVCSGGVRCAMGRWFAQHWTGVLFKNDSNFRTGFEPHYSVGKWAKYFVVSLKCLKFWISARFKSLASFLFIFVLHRFVLKRVHLWNGILLVFFRDPCHTCTHKA